MDFSVHLNCGWRLFCSRRVYTYTKKSISQLNKTLLGIRGQSYISRLLKVAWGSTQNYWISTSNGWKIVTLLLCWGWYWKTTPKALHCQDVWADSCREAGWSDRLMSNDTPQPDVPASSGGVPQLPIAFSGSRSPGSSPYAHLPHVTSVSPIKWETWPVNNSQDFNSGPSTSKGPQHPPV